MLPERAVARRSPAAFVAFDWLSAIVAVPRSDGSVQYANAALEQALGVSRHTLVGSDFTQYFAHSSLIQSVLSGAHGHAFAAIRFEAVLLRLHQGGVPVHIHLSMGEFGDHLVVELWPLGQQARQDREERLLEQSGPHKELIRNLAHEIKIRLVAFEVQRSCLRLSCKMSSSLNTRM